MGALVELGAVLKIGIQVSSIRANRGAISTVSWGKIYIPINTRENYEHALN
jgi:hypothetical protein